jgi:Raf kinase inhibitor-like YbhB/YbcL family protein
MRQVVNIYFVRSILIILMTACAPASITPASPEPVATSQPTISTEPPATEASMSLELTSDAFVNGQSIPAKYACTGRNISPALAWGEPPTGTQSFALLMEDPDAPGGTWVHWVLFNIPADVRSLQENMDTSAMSAGKNSWGDLSYGGPCPPSGTHRYFFKLYALDSTLSLSPGATKEQVLEAIEGHILAQTELMGTFSK